MSGLPGLYLRMLRYRVAAMVWMFLLLGAAHPDGLEALSVDLLWATIALASSYVAATTVNDIADAPIDRINHPNDRGRPLVSGAAEPRQLWLLHVVAWVLALASAALLGRIAVALVLASLVIGVVYSVPPLTLSHRTWLAPCVLSLAYVAIPFALGAVAVGRGPAPRDGLFAGALGCLFLARIVLKDFRDREGDARYGRPTLLLRFGKTATCASSLVALVLGSALLLAAVGAPLTLVALTATFAGSIGWMLQRLWRAEAPRQEQVAIGLGARMGNGMLICVLAWLVLGGEGAAPAERSLFVSLLASVFVVGFLPLAARPERAVIGYKG